MKSDEKALFEMKSDEKALLDEKLKSFVGDEGGVGLFFATKKVVAKKRVDAGWPLNPKGAIRNSSKHEIRNLRSRKCKKIFYQNWNF